MEVSDDACNRVAAVCQWPGSRAGAGQARNGRRCVGILIMSSPEHSGIVMQVNFTFESPHSQTYCYGVYIECQLSSITSVSGYGYETGSVSSMLQSHILSSAPGSQPDIDTTLLHGLRGSRSQTVVSRLCCSIFKRSTQHTDEY